MSLSPPVSNGFPTRRPARWSWRVPDPVFAAQLVSDAGLPPLLARILSARGLASLDEAERFLRPGLAQLNNPFDLKGMDAAVERLGRAIAQRESIMIYGDYDVDGVTATAILMLTLKELGVTADYYIPNRLSEGYGLHMEAVEQLAADGARLIVTVDCGITAVAEVARAAERGMDVIVTDHHEPGPELPPAVAVVNPKQPGCPYPFKGLAGAGVAFKLAHAILKQFHPDADAAREFLKTLLDLAALGTVADIVPLMGENRPIVAHGLERLRLLKRPGLLHLFNKAGLTPSQLDAGAISFIVAPRLNAAGRTEHAMFGVELLLTDDNAQARELARRLEDFNENRRDIEQATLEEALGLLEPCAEDPVLVVAQEGWHQGVLGIVASRILGQYYRPTIVIGVDGGVARGSGRSIAGFDLLEALKASAGSLNQFGGHKMAAGLELDAARIDDFRRAINDYARTVLDDEIMCPLVTIDADAAPEDLTPELIARLEAMAPYGMDNPKPVIALDGCRLSEPPRLLRGGRHMKLICCGPDGRPLTALAWSMAHRIDELAQGANHLRLAGTPTLNTYGGRTTVEIELKDFQVL